jgi:hypothetical protein
MWRSDPLISSMRFNRSLNESDIAFFIPLPNLV